MRSDWRGRPHCLGVILKIWVFILKPGKSMPWESVKQEGNIGFNF